MAILQLAPDPEEIRMHASPARRALGMLVVCLMLPPAASRGAAITSQGSARDEATISGVNHRADASPLGGIPQRARSRAPERRGELEIPVDLPAPDVVRLTDEARA